MRPHPAFALPPLRFVLASACLCQIFAPLSAPTLVCASAASTLDSFSTEKDYDVFLAELVFSQSDVRDDVLKNLDKATDEGYDCSHRRVALQGSRTV